MYSIYVHTTPDGKKYVGSTSLEPNRRFQGGNHYKHNIHFYDAINFFGWDNIKHEILEIVEDKETALKREEYYTLLWRTNEPDFGYNIYVCQNKSEETKNRISEKMRVIKKKPVRLKNINTGEIFMFDSQQSCAEFFMTNNASVCRFINFKVQSRTFKDYEVLKTVKK